MSVLYACVHVQAYYILRFQVNLLIKMNISAQIQFIPTSLRAWLEVDTAIELIENSGLTYKWGRFRTNVEGPKIQVLNLIDQLLSLTTCEEFLLNVQYHIGENRLSNEEKGRKFEQVAFSVAFGSMFAADIRNCSLKHHMSKILYTKTVEAQH